MWYDTCTLRIVKKLFSADDRPPAVALAQRFPRWSHGESGPPAEKYRLAERFGFGKARGAQAGNVEDGQATKTGAKEWEHA